MSTPLKKPRTYDANYENSKFRTVRLYGALGTKYGREHRLYINTPRDAVRLLALNYPELDAELKHGTSYTYAILVGKRHLNLNTNLNELDEPPGNGDIRIVPIPMGAKRAGLFQTILGVALIVVSLFVPATYPATAAFLSSAGVGLALGGVAQLLSPQPSLSLGESNNKSSQYFNGPAQTVAQGNPVPIFYGEGIIGSVPISAGIYAENSN